MKNDYESKKSTNTDIHRKALMLFDEQYNMEREERKNALQDRRFCDVAGAQWEGDLGKFYENRLKLEINKVQGSILRIQNEWRNNRVSVKFVTKTGEVSKDTETCQALYRADEQYSRGIEACDVAFDEALKGGIGAYLLETEYVDPSDPEDDQQKITFRSVTDADSSAYWFGSLEQDKQDAHSCILITALTPEDYKTRYGDDVASWNKDMYGLEWFDWYQPNVIYVGEYFEKEETEEIVLIYRTLSGMLERYTELDFDDNEDLTEELKAVGTVFERSKKIIKTRVHKYVLSGNKIIEDVGYIAGSELPLIPVYGVWSVISGIERFRGHVRPAKDSQKLKNIQTSKLGEISAKTSEEKPIFDVTQMQNPLVKALWANDAVDNNPYLLMEALRNDDGSIAQTQIQYTKPANLPPVLAALLQLTEGDLTGLLGNQQEGEKVRSNISEETLDLVQDAISSQYFIYMSNMAKSKQRGGQVWISMAKDIYIEKGRKMRGVNNAGEDQQMVLGEKSMTDGVVHNVNDLTAADFEVFSSVGASYKTRKRATVSALTKLLPLIQDPQEVKILSQMILMNMEGEGIDEVQDYYRKSLVKMGVIEPTEAEAKELAELAENQTPDANEEYLKEAANEKKTAAEENLADIRKKNAEAEETEVDTQLKKNQLIIDEIEKS